MNVRVDLSKDARSRYGLSAAGMAAIRGDVDSLRFGNGVRGKTVPNPRFLNGPAFDLGTAPVNARVVPLLDLGLDECRWPLGDGRPQLFCGAPTGSKACGQYCAHHAAMAVGEAE